MSISARMAERAMPERPPVDHPSLGRIVGDATADLQRLVRQEIALAKAEMRQEATKAGKAAGMLGGAGFAGYMVAITLTAACVIALGHVLDFGYAAAIIAGLWALIGVILFLAGRHRLRTISPKPWRTVETLRDDAYMARHPIAPYGER